MSQGFVGRGCLFIYGIEHLRSRDFHEGKTGGKINHVTEINFWSHY